MHRVGNEVVVECQVFDIEPEVAVVERFTINERFLENMAKHLYSSDVAIIKSVKIQEKQ